MAGFATRTGFTGHASLGAKAGPAVRLNLDHPMGAGHRGRRSLRTGNVSGIRPLSVTVTVPEIEPNGVLDDNRSKAVPGIANLAHADGYRAMRTSATRLT